MKNLMTLKTFEVFAEDDVTKGKCMNLLPMMNFLEKLKEDLLKIDITELSDDFMCAAEGCVDDARCYDTMEELLNNADGYYAEFIEGCFEEICDALSTKFRADSTNTSADVAKSKLFYTGLNIIIRAYMEGSADFRLACALHKDDKLRGDKDKVKGLKLYNTICLDCTEDLTEVDPEIISVSDFTLTLKLK